MITVSLFFSFTLIGIISFFTIKKATHTITLIFLLMVIEFFFTSFISVIVDNAKLWTVTQSTRYLIMFRVIEVVVFPLLLLWYIESVKRVGTFSKKLIITVLWVGVLVGVETILSHFHIFTYEKWKVWGSIIVWFTFLSFLHFLQGLFSRILFKEGIRN
ncbi:hypothetical protein QFZ87_004912 [Bacillus sp. SLBN-46]|uniref:hypothetical protein n=1 Tax=Bacillus sp. SLBN-46 TaxID=3042283 RepID=UPI00285F5312|nr:hypothetical protein [Bacillus sp. SLBN-46]MDR6125315.1 hypothetical protein [Bacillus sp. SLBN-46]